MEYIGIDIGAGYSCISVIPEGEEIPQLCRSPSMLYEVPSVVWYRDDGAVVVGEDSRAAMKKGTPVFDQIIKGPKRHVGTDETWTVVQNGRPLAVTPADAVSEIIRYLLSYSDVRRFLDADPEYRCVLSVPAFYSKNERKIVAAAAEKAGLKDVRLLSKPIATVLAYDVLAYTNVEKGGILVFQLGAYALDVSVLYKDGNGRFSLLYTTGSQKLGGYDWDTRIVEEMKRQYAEFRDIPVEDVEKDDSVCCVFRQEAGKIKKELTDVRKFDDHIFAVDSNFYFALTRDKFKALCQGLLDEAMGYITDALENIEDIALARGIENFSIQKVLLEGGSCKMPMIREEFSRRFPQFDGMAESFDPEYAAAEGAAIYAREIGGSEPAAGEEALCK